MNSLIKYFLTMKVRTMYKLNTKQEIKDKEKVKRTPY